MDQIGPRREERLRELARDFVPVFGNGGDADLAATILVMALASPIIEEDRPCYRRYMQIEGMAELAPMPIQRHFHPWRPNH